MPKIRGSKDISYCLQWPWEDDDDEYYSENSRLVSPTSTQREHVNTEVPGAKFQNRIAQVMKTLGVIQLGAYTPKLDRYLLYGERKAL